MTASGEAVSQDDFIIPPPSYDVDDVAFGGRLSYGQSRTVNIVREGQVGLLLFDGTAGDWVNAGMPHEAFSNCTTQMYGPSGALLAQDDICTHPLRGIEYLTEVRLTETGTHSLVITPYDRPTGAPTVMIVNDVLGTMIVDGPSAPVTITRPLENARLTFSAQGGTHVSVTFTDITFDNTYASVRDANNVNLTDDQDGWVSDCCGGFIDVDIPGTGTYTLLVNPDLEETGSATATLRTVPPDPTTSVSIGGASASLTTTVAGQRARFTFSGSPGQRVSARMTPFTVSSSSAFTLLSPDGTVIASRDFNAPASFIDALNLPVVGTYTVLVDPPEENTGNATVGVYDATDFNGTAVIDGGAAAVSVSVPGQNALVTFAGTAGQRVNVQLSGVTISSSAVSVLNPDGSVLVTPQNVTTSGRLIELKLAATGTHTVFVNPSGTNTGNLSLTLSTPQSDAADTVVVDGSGVTVTIAGTGQVARVTFTGSAGQHIAVRLTSVTIASSALSILSPGGSTLAGPIAVSTSGGFLDVILTETGTHTVLVDPAQSNTGSATVTVTTVPADVTDSITLGGPPVAISIATSGQNAQVTFIATAGQRVSLRMTSSITSTDVTLRSPGGTALATTSVSTFGGFLDTNVLAESGTYTIEVNPRVDHTGNITLTLYEVPSDASATTTPGGPPITISFNTPGQNGEVTFSANVGQRVAIALSNVSIFGSMQVLSPTGVTIAQNSNVSNSTFVDATTLSEAGTFTIRFNPSADDTGSVTVTVFAVPADLTGTITIGGPGVPVTLSTPGQNAALTFDGTVGQQVTVRVTGNTITSVTVRLTGPDNATITSSTSSAANFNLVTQFLPITGPYRVRVDPVGARTGALTVSVTTP